jgi:tyrosinase
MVRLGASAATAKAVEGAAAVESKKNVELVGANKDALRVTGSEVRTSVQLDQVVRRKVAASLAQVPAQTGAPDRVFLKLENVRGLVDATSFHVYVNLPEGAKVEDHPELLAGTVGLFGVRKASIKDEAHAGQGLSFTLEITDIVDAMHLKNSLNVDALDVRIVPVRAVPEEAQVSIGRVSIFRQGP